MDRLGKICEKCETGTYTEKRPQDDFEVKVECNWCNEKVDRYSDKVEQFWMEQIKSMDVEEVIKVWARGCGKQQHGLEMFLEKVKDLPPDYAKLIQEHFWELV